MMHVTLVHVYVLPPSIAGFIEATRENHEASIEEVGNVRFDVLQDPEDPQHFMLYEVYQSPEDAAHHKTTDHYLRWRLRVEGMMAKPRQGIAMDWLFPA